MELKPLSSEYVSRLRSKRPLVLNLSNFVSLDFVANALLAVGASPIMSFEAREMKDLVALSSAVVINMGTPSAAWLELVELTWDLARTYDKPVVFDPVGSGASTLRTEMARSLLQRFPATIVRGNASEITSLFDAEQWTKGVDSAISSELAYERLHPVMSDLPTTYVISGKRDFILDAETTYGIDNGHSLMGEVTGSGCVATAIIAAFCAVQKRPAQAALHAMTMMGLAGEQAARTATGPGSFRVAFIDALASEHLDFGTARVQRL